MHGLPGKILLFGLFPARPAMSCLYVMPQPPLTGAHKTRLRGLGQTLPDTLHVGREGASASVTTQLDHELTRRELVKVRLTGGQDRPGRAALHEALAAATHSVCVGAVGHTALFWRPGNEGSKLLPPNDPG